ncbi:MAG: hypothetical protein MK033_04880 [Candidatus Caenarcaniphilales bacterium]|nr:hypothetical protein [Candidatus Caenarcaniphilales bacterium]
MNNPLNEEIPSYEEEKFRASTQKTNEGLRSQVLNNLNKARFLSDDDKFISSASKI